MYTYIDIVDIFASHKNPLPKGNSENSAVVVIGLLWNPHVLQFDSNKSFTKHVTVQL